MELLFLILDCSRDALLGGLGGFVGALYHFGVKRKKNKDEKLDLTMVFIHICTGVFAAYCISTEIPADSEHRRLFIGLIGLSSFPLIGALESKVVARALKALDKFLPGTE